MDKAALVGIHRLKGYGPMLTNSSRCSTLRHLGDLIATTTLVALDIDHDGESEAKLTTQQQREHSLERFKRTPVTAPSDEAQKRALGSASTDAETGAALSDDAAAKGRKRRTTSRAKKRVDAETLPKIPLLRRAPTKKTQTASSDEAAAVVFDQNAPAETSAAQAPSIFIEEAARLEAVAKARRADTTKTTKASKAAPKKRASKLNPALRSRGEVQIEKGAATALENAEDFNEAFPVRLAVAEKTLPRTSPAVLPDLELIKRAEAERALEAMARKIKREAQKREKGYAIRSERGIPVQRLCSRFSICVLWALT